MASLRSRLASFRALCYARVRMPTSTTQLTMASMRVRLAALTDEGMACMCWVQAPGCMRCPACTAPFSLSHTSLDAQHVDTRTSTRPQSMCACAAHQHLAQVHQRHTVTRFLVNRAHWRGRTLSCLGPRDNAPQFCCPQRLPPPSTGAARTYISTHHFLQYSYPTPKQ